MIYEFLLLHDALHYLFLEMQRLIAVIFLILLSTRQFNTDTTVKGTIPKQSTELLLNSQRNYSWRRQFNTETTVNGTILKQLMELFLNSQRNYSCSKRKYFWTVNGTIPEQSSINYFWTVTDLLPKQSTKLFLNRQRNYSWTYKTHFSVLEHSASFLKKIFWLRIGGWPLPIYRPVSSF